MMKRIIPAFIFFGILLIFSVNPGIPQAHAGNDFEITILYTNSLNGNIDFCKCKESPKGGLVKRATEINKIRRESGRVFLFETGDFFPFDPDSLLAMYIVRAYRYISYDAMVFGDQEFTIGAGEFAGHLKNLPFVADNIFIPGAGGNLPRYRIIEKDKIRVGVIGTISPGAFRYYPQKITKDIRIGNQADEINRDADELRKKGVHVIVLLSHSGFDADRELMKKIRGVHVIIGGHSQTLVKKPVIEENMVLVQAGADGSRIGILQLTLSGGIIKSVKNSFRHPTEDYPEDDDYIRRLINEYTERSKKDLDKIKLD